MFTDAHLHPFNLTHVFPEAEEERRRLTVTAAASSCCLEEFTHNENLARIAASDKAAAILPCFAVHPQLPAVEAENGGRMTQDRPGSGFADCIAVLQELAEAGRLAAVGECGFDLYNAAFRETEAVQDWLFARHLETALRHDLPVIIHARRAAHKIFNSVKNLAKCRAVIFHSWQGTSEEGQALLGKGVNAYFSFGNSILNGHKRAMRCCALLPAQRLLTETDAPFQPQRGKSFSHYADLPDIIAAIAALRHEAQNDFSSAKDIETIIEKNFFDVFITPKNALSSL